ncbi:hypothetical protein EVAR_18060_1 [Eumeta japonica]|uniref:Mariner Mos1 transposase n=1 Tax=Eumeta variegata TaxID=151549 RepID=A0A4C1VI53_EUMVA|nr:hypothetical protein EVAR_18060_1 [Eumeta japonica]
MKNHQKPLYYWFSDESWIYAYDPETKQSTVRLFQDEPNPTKVICAKSTLKIIPHDNASCHTSAKISLFLEGQKTELTGHPPGTQLFLFIPKREE